MTEELSSAGEDILHCLFGTWLDLSDLSTDHEPILETATLLPPGLVYFTSLVSLLSFHSPFTSTILRLSTFEAKELMPLENSAPFLNTNYSYGDR